MVFSGRHLVEVAQKHEIRSNKFALFSEAKILRAHCLRGIFADTAPFRQRWIHSLGPNHLSRSFFQNISDRTFKRLELFIKIKIRVIGDADDQAVTKSKKEDGNILNIKSRVYFIVLDTFPQEFFKEIA